MQDALDVVNPKIAKQAYKSTRRFWGGRVKRGDSDGEQFLDIKKRKRLAGKERGHLSSVFSS